MDEPYDVCDPYPLSCSFLTTVDAFVGLISAIYVASVGNIARVRNGTKTASRIEHKSWLIVLHRGTPRKTPDELNKKHNAYWKDTNASIQDGARLLGAILCARIAIINPVVTCLNAGSAHFEHV